MDEKPKAVARGTNLQISFKQAVNIGRAIRGKELAYAVRLLTDVTNMRRPIPVVKYGRDTPHKPGTAAGRYPAKACKEVMLILGNVIANAGVKHMDVGKLFISRYECNREVSKNRAKSRRIGRLTNIMIEVQEKEEKKKPTKKEAPKPKLKPKAPKPKKPAVKKPAKKPKAKPKPKTKPKPKPKPKPKKEAKK
jgi:large subunit ribosomal protein L22